MPRLLSAVLLGCFLVGAVGTATADSKTGEIKFTGPKKESTKVSLGDKVKLEAKFEQIQVGTLSAVSVGGTVKNPGNKLMYYSYHVAFLDKDKNLIGCQQFGGGEFPGKDGPVGTFIALPPEQIAKIAYYSVAFYESDKSIGSK